MKQIRNGSPALRAILREAAASARLIGGLADAPVALFPAEREEMRRFSAGLASLAAETRRAPRIGPSISRGERRA